ncbi:AAA family ATPase [Lutibaculum baratangense]|nr:AAA family ATPase [Lutibaculum baratangense]
MALKGSADRKTRQPLSRSRKAPLEKRLPRGLVDGYRSLRGSQWRPQELAAAIIVGREVEARPELVEALREDEPMIVFLVQDEEERQPIANAIRRGLLPSFGLSKVLRGPQVAGLRFEAAGPEPLGMVFVGDQIVGRESRRRPEGLTKAMRLPGPIVIVGAPDEVPRAIQKTADATIKVPRLDGGTLAEVMSICLAPTETEPEPVPDDLLRDLSLEDLPMLMRPGDTRSRAVERLRRMQEGRASSPGGKGAPRKTSARLDTIGGFGAAREWGLSLAQDIADYKAGDLDWSEIDRGLLLSGPTGVGKTFFAQALANTCDVPLVVGSLGEWQVYRNGNLGDMLKAMRQAFEEAESEAPSILFIDELDGIGDRRYFRHDHAEYRIQVVNHLLELVDGIDRREGVVVIGACNMPHRIDPALLRSGRLERHIRIPPPSMKDLALILRYHLGAADIGPRGPIVRELLGMTGADVERVVRDARKIARRARRKLRQADLIAAATGERPPPPFEEAYRVAVHEVAQAVMIYGSGLGEVEEVALTRGGRTGHTDVVIEEPELPTRGWIENRTLVHLAGRAAEEVVLGEPSMGAGGDENSDLARATDLVMTMAGSGGLGPEGSLVWLGPPTRLREIQFEVPSLLTSVEADLKAMYKKAVFTIEAHRDLIETLAKRLVRKGIMSSDEVRDALLEHLEGLGADGPADQAPPAAPP